MKAVNASEALLKATLAMDEKTVARMIQEVHMQSSSSLIYNNEISLSSVIALAYYSACKDYTLIRELPTGNSLQSFVTGIGVSWHLALFRQCPASSHALEYNGFPAFWRSCGLLVPEMLYTGRKLHGCSGCP